MDDVGHYVYGVVAAPADTPTPYERGIDPAFGVELLRQGALAAITSRVRLEQLSHDGGEGRLAELAVRHEHVLESFLVAGLNVLPFQFGTLCASDSDVSRLLEAREAALTTALVAVDGKLEVGVRISVDPDRVRESLLEQDDDLRRRHAELETLTPGAAHLRRKQLDRHLSERVSIEAARATAALHSDLTFHAAAARPGAYLVPQGDVDAFIERAQATARELGLRIDVTGPWPPYSFAALEGDADG